MNTKNMLNDDVKIDGNFCNVECKRLALVSKWKYPYCRLFSKYLQCQEEKPCRCSLCVLVMKND